MPWSSALHDFQACLAWDLFGAAIERVSRHSVSTMLALRSAIVLASRER